MRINQPIPIIGSAAPPKEPGAEQMIAQAVGMLMGQAWAHVLDGIKGDVARLTVEGKHAELRTLGANAAAAAVHLADTFIAQRETFTQVLIDNYNKSKTNGLQH